jgi:hypothetical protein
VIKTVFGEVEYSRAVYKTELDTGSACIYLLDAILGEKKIGHMSSLLAEQIAKSVCESTYRETARHIGETTGQRISHQTAWAVTQRMGEQVCKRENDLAEQAKAQKSVGNIETKVLFEERDGIWLHLQGKDRRKQGASKEMKIGIAYEGVKITGKNRREYSGKTAHAGIETALEFQRKQRGVIAEKYNIDEIEMRILNGDGAKWITSDANDEVYCQLDPYHRNKAIMQKIPTPEARKKIFKYLSAGESEKALEYINILADSLEGTIDTSNIRALHKYLSARPNWLIPAHSCQENFPKVKEGLEFSHCGGMESNVFTIIGNRMKGRRRSWSINGANHLAALLCLKHTGQMGRILPSIIRGVLGERYEEEKEEDILSAKKSVERVGKGYNGFHRAPIPAMEWSKSLLGMRSFGEL